MASVDDLGQRDRKRLSDVELEALQRIFQNVEGGSLELFSRLKPAGRAYFLSLAEPILTDVGDDASLDALYSVDYDRRPVDPYTFLDHSDYMGHVGCDVFPAWRPIFDRINRQNNRVHEVIITGAMGIGKTMISMLSCSYAIYKVGLLKDPARFYGLQRRSKVVFGLYALTKAQIEDVGFYLLRDMMIDQSPYFCDVFTRSPYGKETIHWPLKGIHVITGSGQLHAVGQNIFFVVADELNYFARGEQTATRARELVADVSRRQESRFVQYGGDIPGCAMFLSQTRTSRDFLESRIRDSRDRDGVLVVRGPRWAFNPKGYDSSDPKRGYQEGDPAFRVFCGDEVQDARILDDVRRLPDGTDQITPLEDREPDGQVIDVPILHYRAFHDDLHGSLRAIADVPTASFTPFFPRREVIGRAFDAELEFPFPRQNFPCHERSATRLQDLYDYAATTRITMGRREPVRHPAAPRYIHLDLSQTGDRTGMAMVHPSGHYVEDISPVDAIDAAGVGEGEVVKRVEVDFYIALEAGPFKEPIDYSKIRVFVEWLRRCGFWIRKITADYHQSFDMLQRFREMGFETDKVSVDRTPSLAYKTLRQSLNERRIQLPFPTGLRPQPISADDLARILELDMNLDAEMLARRERALSQVLVFHELVGLEHNVERDKVDHRATNPDGSKGSKDVADAITGAVWSCLMDKIQPEMRSTLEVGSPRGAVADKLMRYLRFVRGHEAAARTAGG